LVKVPGPLTVALTKVTVAVALEKALVMLTVAPAHVDVAGAVDGRDERERAAGEGSACGRWRR
jgi:hypothetical protein